MGRGIKVLVTGGGTVAPIDDVRSITNASTGRFSAAITEACLRLGAEVWHLHAPTAALPFLRASRFNLDTLDPVAEHAHLDALRSEWQRFKPRLHLMPLATGTVSEYAASLHKVLTEQSIDIAFLAMAVSDFEPDPFPGKIDSKAEGFTIQVHRAPKVIRAVRDWSPDVFLVGFKLLSRAEPAELIAAADEACRTNHADVTVANDLRTVLDGRHTVHLVRPGAPAETLHPGDDLAERTVDRVFSLARERRQVLHSSS